MLAVVFFSFIKELRNEYQEDNNVLIGANEKGDVQVPLSRTEFEDFHKIYIQYNDNMKKLLERIYKDLLERIESLEKRLAVVEAELKKVKKENYVTNDNYNANRQADAAARSDAIDDAIDVAIAANNKITPAKAAFINILGMAAIVFFVITGVLACFIAFAVAHKAYYNWSDTVDFWGSVWSNKFRN